MRKHHLKRDNCSGHRSAKW